MASSSMYFQRLVCLEVDGVSEVLRDLLRCYACSEASVAVFIGKHESYLETLLNNKTIYKDQFDLLIPPPRVPFDIDKLDITCLCTVLLYKTACKLSGSEVKCIHALKDTRKKYAHAPNTSIDKCVFTQIWYKVETNLLELAKIVEIKQGDRTYVPRVTKKIKAFKINPLEQLQGRMLERIIEWFQLQNAENRQNRAMENMFGCTEKYLHDQDRSQSAAACMLQSTNLFITLKEELEDKPVALTGMDEEMVTLLAKELVKEVRGEGGKCLSRDVSEDWTHVEFEKIDVLLLFVDKIDKRWYWSMLKDCLENKSLKLIMIYKEDRMEREIRRTFCSCCFEEVQSDIFAVGEKVNILKQSLQKIGMDSLPNDFIEQCVKDFESPIGFLQTCQKLLRDKPAVETSVKTLFRFPFEVLATMLYDFMNPSDSPTMEISVNILFFNKGQLNISNLPKDYDKDLLDILETTCTNLCPGKHLNINMIKKDFKRLHSFIVNHTATKTVFLPMMYEVVAMNYAKENPVKAIECCTLDFLLKHVAFGHHDDKQVLVNLEKTSEIIKAVANRLLEEVSIQISKANNRRGFDQLTTDIIQPLLGNKRLSHSFEVFLECLEEKNATPPDSYVDDLYCAVLYENGENSENSEFVAKIVAGRKDKHGWDENSKGVARAVLEAYISPRNNVYDKLIESGTLTILQYVAVFAKEGDTTSLNRLLKEIKAKDWVETSSDVLDALKFAMARKDEDTCKAILEKGVVFDTVFIKHAVFTGEINIIKMIVSHMEIVLKTRIAPLCAELTESMVNTDSPNYKDVYKYLRKCGAMCAFRLIHSRVVNEQFESARDMIQKLSRGKVWEKGNDYIVETLNLLQENVNDTTTPLLKEISEANARFSGNIRDASFDGVKPKKNKKRKK